MSAIYFVVYNFCPPGMWVYRSFVSCSAWMRYIAMLNWIPSICWNMSC